MTYKNKVKNKRGILIDIVHPYISEGVGRKGTIAGEKLYFLIQNAIIYILK